MEEIELTFLAKELPKGLLNSPSKELLDIYIPAKKDHPSLRIRKSGDRHEITKKEPIKEGDASHQFEKTIPLTSDEFEELNMLKGKRVEKTRYYYKEGETNFEVDVFKGDLIGLMIVDVEFSSLEEKAKFKMPSWCLAEITQEEFVAGGMICGKKYEDIEKDLERFGYKKI